jgi:hypothetical protein
VPLSALEEERRKRNQAEADKAEACVNIQTQVERSAALEQTCATQFAQIELARVEKAALERRIHELEAAEALSTTISGTNTEPPHQSEPQSAERRQTLQGMGDPSRATPPGTVEPELVKIRRRLEVEQENLRQHSEDNNDLARTLSGQRRDLNKWLEEIASTDERFAKTVKESIDPEPAPKDSYTNKDLIDLASSLRVSFTVMMGAFNQRFGNKPQRGQTETTAGHVVPPPGASASPSGDWTQNFTEENNTNPVFQSDGTYRTQADGSPSGLREAPTTAPVDKDSAHNTDDDWSHMWTKP